MCRGTGGFLRVSGDTGKAGRDRELGFWGCSRNKCREHRGEIGEKPLSRTGVGQIGALGVYRWDMWGKGQKALKAASRGSGGESFI